MIKGIILVAVGCILEVSAKDTRLIGIIECSAGSCKVHCGRNINKKCEFITINKYGINPNPTFLDGYHIDCGFSKQCKIECSEHTKNCKIRGSRMITQSDDIGGFGVGDMDKDGYIQPAFKLNDMLWETLAH